MYTISKQFSFSASHILEGLPEGHPCGRLHGHNYTVEVVLRADKLDDVGFVLDYGSMRPFQEYLDKYYDHRHLNDVLGPGVQPSAETLAFVLYSHAAAILPAHVVRVRVAETPKTWAEYEPGWVDPKSGVTHLETNPAGVPRLPQGETRHMFAPRGGGEY